MSQPNRVGLDTMCFIYHLQENPEYITYTTRLFNDIENNKITASTSTLTLTEILTKPYQTGNTRAAKDFRYILENYPNLTLHPFDPDTADLAAQLKARYSIRTPDAIHVASSITSNCIAFITNDHKLEKIQEIKVQQIQSYR